MSAADQPDLAVSQNYLTNPRLVAALLDRSTIGPEDLVVEIGPGKGIITAQLARRCRQVVAVEKDAALASALRRKCARLPNLTIRSGDFLDYSLPGRAYKVFSNIPFNHTAAILARLTNAANPPVDAWLVMQREAAATYLGSPCQTLRSVLLQPWFELERVHHFRRTDFTPQPHVDAVLLRLCKRSPPLVADCDRQAFRDFVAFCFSAWRPTIGETLKSLFSYRQWKQVCRGVRIEPAATPTDTRFEQWLGLFQAFKAVASPGAAWTVHASAARLRRQQGKLRKVHRTTRHAA